MKNKNLIIGVSVVLVAIILIGGGYDLFHKSKNTTPPKAAYSTTQSTTQSTSTSTTKDIIQTESNSSVGKYLATSSGMALYTYSNDTSGVSNCSGSCLQAWPAYAPTSSSETLPANVTIITRTDGTKQYAYKGLPLYTFYSDTAGQVTGNGVSGFVLAKP
ncbi:MAG TPA: hypothetical protein VIH90_00530 [Candidatus Saccharimonadales bacterium]